MEGKVYQIAVDEKQVKAVKTAIDNDIRVMDSEIRFGEQSMTPSEYYIEQIGLLESVKKQLPK